MGRRLFGLELVQWFVLLAAPLAWAGQHIVGLGVSIAHCNAGGSRWDLAPTTWQIALTAAAGTVAMLAVGASVLLFRRVRGRPGDPPTGRYQFFAYAGIGENVVFLAIILMTGLGSLYHLPCHQS